MSGVAILRSLIVANAPLIAQIPAIRIYAGVAPVNTVIPAIAITQISGQQHNTVAMTESPYIFTERVQITVFAKTYPLQKSYLSLIRAALPNQHGTINGFNTDSILPDIESPDMYDSVALIYMQGYDFIVRYFK